MKAFAAGLFAVVFTTAAYAGETVTYKANGSDYEGYFAKAAGASKGLVLIIHDWDGLNGYERKRADMLATAGYDAFAADLFGKGNRPATVPARIAETSKLSKDRAKMRSRLLAALTEAQKKSGGDTVVIGYCFGGGAALELARSGQASKVKGYVTFHGNLATPPGQSYPQNTPPILITHGGADTIVKMSDVAALSAELEKGGIRYDIEVYSGAPHAFTVFGAKSYRERADKRSWESFTEFLRDRLGG